MDRYFRFRSHYKATMQLTDLEIKPKLTALAYGALHPNTAMVQFDYL